MLLPLLLEIAPGVIHLRAAMTGSQNVATLASASEVPGSRCGSNPRSSSVVETTRPVQPTLTLFHGTVPPAPKASRLHGPPARDDWSQRFRVTPNPLLAGYKAPPPVHEFLETGRWLQPTGAPPAANVPRPQILVPKFGFPPPRKPTLSSNGVSLRSSPAAARVPATKLQTGGQHREGFGKT